MATKTKIKGIYKSLKSFSQIFVVKESQREMEIGYPTDVKHLSHIGSDASSGNAPSWMTEFKTSSDFSTTSLGNSRGSNSVWSSQDFEQSMGHQPEHNMFKDIPSTNSHRNVPKSHKRKKSKSTSSPRNLLSSSRSSLTTRSKHIY
ncbi:hypothetical protein ACFE04_001526 [Oxalis oulophora]